MSAGMREAEDSLTDQLEAELVDYVGDDSGWARQAARQVVESIRLAGWVPPVGVMPAEEEPEGCR